MSSKHWFSVVYILLALSASAQAQDFSDFPDFDPPGDGEFTPPMGGGMRGPRMGDMRDLIKWKEDNATNPRVVEFDRTHTQPEFPRPGQRPRMGERPDFSKMREQREAMETYLTALRELKASIEAEPETPTPSTEPESEPKAEPPVEAPTVERVQVQTDSATEELKEKAQEGQCEVCRSKQSAPVQPNLGALKSMVAEVLTTASTGRERLNPEDRQKMQERLVQSRVSEIEETTDDLKYEAEEYKDKECRQMRPDGAGGRPPFGDMPSFDDEDFGERRRFADRDRDDEDEDEEESDRRPRRRGMEPPFGPRGPGEGGPRPGGRGENDSLIQTLLLDLPDSLQRRLDRANEKRIRAKKDLRSEKKKWRKRCEREQRRGGGAGGLGRFGQRGERGGMNPGMPGGMLGSPEIRTYSQTYGSFGGGSPMMGGFGGGFGGGMGGGMSMMGGFGGGMGGGMSMMGGYGGGSPMMGGFGGGFGGGMGGGMSMMGGYGGGSPMMGGYRGGFRSRSPMMGGYRSGYAGMPISSYSGGFTGSPMIASYGGGFNGLSSLGGYSSGGYGYYCSTSGGYPSYSGYSTFGGLYGNSGYLTSGGYANPQYRSYVQSGIPYRYNSYASGPVATGFGTGSYGMCM